MRSLEENALLALYSQILVVPGDTHDINKYYTEAKTVEALAASVAR